MGTKQNSKTGLILRVKILELPDTKQESKNRANANVFHQ